MNREPQNFLIGLNIYLWLLRAVSQLDRLGFDVAVSAAANDTPSAKYPN